MTTDAPADYFVTVPELAEEIRVPVSTVRNWRSLGKGPRSSKFGRRVVYRRSEVDRWLAEQERVTAKGGGA